MFVMIMSVGPEYSLVLLMVPSTTSLVPVFDVRFVPTSILPGA